MAEKDTATAIAAEEVIAIRKFAYKGELGGPVVQLALGRPRPIAGGGSAFACPWAVNGLHEERSGEAAGTDSLMALLGAVFALRAVVREIQRTGEVGLVGGSADHAPPRPKDPITEQDFLLNLQDQVSASWTTLTHLQRRAAHTTAALEVQLQGVAAVEREHLETIAAREQTSTLALARAKAELDSIRQELAGHAPQVEKYREERLALERECQALKVEVSSLRMEHEDTEERVRTSTIKSRELEKRIEVQELVSNRLGRASDIGCNACGELNPHGRRLCASCNEPVLPPR